MNVNPYAPPGQDDWVPGSLPGPGAPGHWEVGEVFSLAWEQFKPQWPILVLAPFLAGLAAGIPNYLPSILLVARVVEPNSAEYWIIYAICMVVAITIGTFFQVGQLRIFLTAVRGGRPELGTLLSGGDRFLPLLGMTLLVTLGIAVGYVFLIVPGIILALGLSLSAFYCVDAGLGPIEAMKASWQATRGHKGKIFLFGLMAFLIAIVGLLACCIGVYAATPVIWMAFAIVYIRLSGYVSSPTDGR